MKLHVLDDPDAAAAAGAEILAREVRAAVDARGRCTLALSGGRTPWVMLSVLAGLAVPWSAVEVLQADERIVPEGSPDRNLTHLRTTLADRVPLPASHLHAMPVDDEPVEGAAAYARTIERLAGRPPVLDLVHLGLGTDGHTASLLPDHPILDVADRWVATTEPGAREARMSLTYPVLNRARTILFVVTGASKAAALARLVRRDPGIPAGRISNGHVILVADADAARSLEDARR